MVPERVSHYRVMKKLGGGGMGEVYLAEDVELSRSVALKVLPRGEESEARLRRFSREAQAASALSHPHVAHLYEVGHDADLYFLAMEYVEGKPLDEYIGGRPLPTEEIVAFGIQIADALQEAHAKGIVHRDIKSSNIIITRRGVKVLDFGLAKMSKSDGMTGAERDTATTTTPGTLVGTPSYMSPEQALGRPIDARTDLFSLGVVLYQMSTGRLPFAGATTADMLHHLVGSQPEAMARFNYGLPAELERIIRKCLEKQPERRYQAAADLLVDLRNLDRDLAPELRARRSIAPSRWPASPKLFPFIGAAALLALLAGLIMLRPEPATRSIIGTRIPSVAVLPLSDLSGRYDYFADGITGELIANLARIGSLRVVSPASALQYRDNRKALSHIFEELDVDTIVELSVIPSGNRIRVNAQVIDAAADRHRWSQAYERPVEEILDLQYDLTMDIAREIPVELDSDLREHFANVSPVNPRAYEFYLKARYDKTALEWADSVDLLEQAIRFDANFGPAYALLADCYVQGSNLGEMPYAEASSRARAAAMKALELDPALPQAHLALSNVKLFLDWDFAGAEESLNRAIQLAPNDAESHRRKAWWGRIMGDRKTELAEATRARQLNPMEIHASLLLAEALVNSQNYAEAVEESRRSLQFPEKLFEHSLARQIMGHALMHQKKSRDGIQLLESIRREAPKRLRRSIQLAHGYLLSGQPSAAREIFDHWLTKRPEPGGSPLEMAMLCSLAGDKEAAFRWLEAAFERHDVNLLSIKEEPFEPLRSDPRYEALLAKIGLPRG